MFFLNRVEHQFKIDLNWSNLNWIKNQFCGKHKRRIEPQWLGRFHFCVGWFALDGLDVLFSVLVWINPNRWFETENSKYIKLKTEPIRVGSLLVGPVSLSFSVCFSACLSKP